MKKYKGHTPGDRNKNTNMILNSAGEIIGEITASDEVRAELIKLWNDAHHAPTLAKNLDRAMELLKSVEATLECICDETNEQTDTRCCVCHIERFLTEMEDGDGS